MTEHHERPEPSIALDERVQRARGDLTTAISVVRPSVERIRARALRQRALVAVTSLGVVVSAVVGTVVLQYADDESSPVVAAGPRVTQPGTGNASLLAPGDVRGLAPAPLSSRSTMASVWTGEEMIVWGGEDVSGPFDDGAAYDPRTDSWRVLPPSPLTARNAPAAVWTGDRMILWGGHGGSSGHSDGAAYDPTSDSWESIAAAPIASAGLPQGVWTGDEMIVLAGFNSTETAAYDPDSDTWRRLDPVPGQPLGHEMQAVWTGEDVVVRAAYRSLGREVRSGVFAYDTRSGRWRELAPPGEGDDRLSNLGYTGDHLIKVTQQPGALVTRYNADSDTWTGIGTWPTDVPPMATSAWTGSHLLLWGGGEEALLLDPRTGALTATPAGGGPARIYPAAVWADGVLILWGGVVEGDGGLEGLDDGVLLRPVTPAPAGPGTTVAIAGVDATGSDADLVRVAGPDGGVGYIDPDAGPTEVNGRLLPVQRVLDDEGNLIGYFACSFLERDVVEDEDFDVADTCTTVTSSTNG